MPIVYRFVLLFHIPHLDGDGSKKPAPIAQAATSHRYFELCLFVIQISRSLTFEQCLCQFFLMSGAQCIQGPVRCILCCIVCCIVSGIPWDTPLCWFPLKTDQLPPAATGKLLPLTWMQPEKSSTTPSCQMQTHLVAGTSYHGRSTIVHCVFTNIQANM